MSHIDVFSSPHLSPLDSLLNTPNNMNETWTLEQLVTPASFAYAFMSSLTLVFLSEFGDKTFIATVLMTMEYNVHDPHPDTITKPSHFRHGLCILLATNLACACIAIITSLLSYCALSWLEIPPIYMAHVSTAACVIFGIQILWDTWGNKTEQEDEKGQDNKQSQTNGKTHSDKPTTTKITHVTPTTETMTSATATPSAPSPVKRRLSIPTSITPSTSLTAVFYRTFFWSLMTELGDRSQLGMMMLSTQQHLSVYGVLCGGVLGHILCTVVAIVFGECSSQYISPKWMATAGGILFLALAVCGV